MAQIAGSETSLQARVCCVFFQTPAPVVKVAENCLRFSPQICVRHEHAVFIEIGKCRRLYSEASFLARLQVVLRRLELTALVAIGKDIPDSLVMAKFGSSQTGSLPLEALLDLADPFARDPVLQKYVLKLISSFRDLGVKTIEQFKKIPIRELSTRFGPVGILCHQRAYGEMPIPWPHWKPEEIISEKEEFPCFEFYGELEPILFSLKKQLDQIFYRLHARNFKAQGIQVRIFCETHSLSPGRLREFDFEFLFPQSSTKGTLNVIKERLVKEFAKKPIRTSIEALETTVTSTVQDVSGQKSLLHNREEITEQLHSLLNQLREAHGQDNVFQAELTEQRLPENSWKKSQKANLLHEEPNAHSGLPILRLPSRPTYLLKPEKVEVTSGYLYIRKKPFEILKWLGGVEKISGGWCERRQAAPNPLENTYDRTYYQLELQGGTRVSLFQTPKQEYFLHGYFG
jgi:hypothetical protein